MVLLVVYNNCYKGSQGIIEGHGVFIIFFHSAFQALCNHSFLSLVLLLCCLHCRLLFGDEGNKSQKVTWSDQKQLHVHQHLQHKHWNRYSWIQNRSQICFSDLYLSCWILFKFNAMLQTLIIFKFVLGNSHLGRIYFKTMRQKNSGNPWKKLSHKEKLHSVFFKMIVNLRKWCKFPSSVYSIFQGWMSNMCPLQKWISESFHTKRL